MKNLKESISVLGHWTSSLEPTAKSCHGKSTSQFNKLKPSMKVVRNKNDHSRADLIWDQEYNRSSETLQPVPSSFTLRNSLWRYKAVMRISFHK